MPNRTMVKKLAVNLLKLADLGSAAAVRLTVITGKAKLPLHPKHLLGDDKWYDCFFTKNDIVLDLGSGNGVNSIKVARKVQRVVGIELNDKLLNQAKLSAKAEQVNNVEFIKGDLEKKLEFKNNQFTKVLFLDVLEHLVKREQVLAEVKRVLQPQGLLILVVPNSLTSWKMFQKSAGVFYYSDMDHKIEYTEHEIRIFLTKGGFDIIQLGYGSYDTPLRGLIDVCGAVSIWFYRLLTNYRHDLAQRYPKEASGFEIVSENTK